MLRFAGYAIISMMVTNLFLTAFIGSCGKMYRLEIIFSLWWLHLYLIEGLIQVVLPQWPGPTVKLPPPLYKSEENKTQSKQYIVYLSDFHKPPTVFQTHSTSHQRQLLSVFTFGKIWRLAPLKRFM